MTTRPDPADPSTDRRAFLLSTGALAATGLLPKEASAVAAVKAAPHPLDVEDEDDAPAPAPSDVTPETVAEAEKLAAVTYTLEERVVIAETIGDQMERVRNARTIDLPNGLAPATVFAAGVPGDAPTADVFVRSADDVGPLPTNDQDIAFAPVTSLSRWIARGEISSTRLTEIYLDRLKRIGPTLECVVTLTEGVAREQAARADRERQARRTLGPLHGIPWGAKDLFDTAGIRTTWGATPYKDRVAETDAAVVKRLEDAGAVLVAKLTLGALAYGDIWFDGKTRNPFNLERGSSGSSAGSASATSAGLVGFSLGTETYGSIVSPCMRCGATGLRPTFGRVSRTGAMALCWSLDKIGAIGRTVEDTALVLDVIRGADAGDPASVDAPFAFDAGQDVRGLRIGCDPAWFAGEAATNLDRAALAAAQRDGARLVEIELPDWPYDSLMSILLAEAAAAFESLTLSDADDELVWQARQAWPNTFRCARFISAIEYVQAQRFRRQVCAMMEEKFEKLDAIIAPSFAGSLLLITNHTGHPSLTLRTGFHDGNPRGITLIGRRWGEGGLCRLGMTIERELDVWHQRPELA